MKVTRKQLLAGAGASALAGAGIYELVDQLSGGAPRRSAVPAGPLPPEQHLLLGVRSVHDNGVEVLVPPLHHQLVTLKLKAASKHDLQRGQVELEQALTSLEVDYPPTPAGLGVTVGWGLPYFHRYLPTSSARYLPLDHRASKAKGKPVRALLDAIRFPSDPPQTILEQNDAVILLRSDSLAAIADGAKRLVKDLDFWQPTSI